MAYIQMVYLEGYCDLNDSYCGELPYNIECHTNFAEDAECKLYYDGEKPGVIAFGDCVHAKFRRRYKGMTVKNYDIRESIDPYNPHLNCMTVETKNKTYRCEKIILDGVCIYDEENDGQPGWNREEVIE